MARSNGRSTQSGGARPPDETVPTPEEIEQLLAEIDASDDDEWELVEEGPGFYRAPTVARQLAEAVSTYRAEHGLTQSELGRKLVLHQSQIARLEAGQHTPELETLVRVARHLRLRMTVTVTPNGAELEVASPAAPATARG